MTRQIVAVLLVSAFAGACDESENHGTTQILVQQTNLTSDQPGVAAHTDPNLVNAWGLAVNPNVSPPVFWISDNGSDHLSLITPDGTPQAPVVSMPGAPTGQVFVPDASFSGDTFIVASESGTIQGVAQSAGAAAAMRIDNSASNAVYKGLALTDNTAGPLLLATDFHNGKVVAFGPGYTAIPTPGFVDPNLPAGYAPFDVADLNGRIYVTYALQDQDAKDDVAGPGNGFVDVFTPQGELVRRLISGGHLNAPWGLALAPASFGALAGDLLVGNFGDGTIDVYDPSSGAWLAQVMNANGSPLVIDGLWAILVGPAGASLDDRIFFTAGPSQETHGLFGVLQVKQAP